MCLLLIHAILVNTSIAPWLQPCVALFVCTEAITPILTSARRTAACLVRQHCPEHDQPPPAKRSSNVQSGMHLTMTVHWASEGQVAGCALMWLWCQQCCTCWVSTDFHHPTQAANPRLCHDAVHTRTWPRCWVSPGPLPSSLGFVPAGTASTSAHYL